VLRLAPLLAFALAGCGSLAAAELPPPAGPPVSPPLSERPAGRVEPASGVPRDVVEDRGREFSLDRPRSRLRVVENGRTREAPTGREPVALALLDRGQRVAVLSGRERMLEIYDADTLERLGRTGAGIGPTDVASDGVELLYVTDVRGDALLVYHLRPFELIRRVHVGGGPYAIAYDRERWGTWIARAGANRLDNYAAGTRPVIRDSLPSIRDARAVRVNGDVVSVHSPSERQVLRARSR
jgi:hypothetical protein